MWQPQKLNHPDGLAAEQRFLIAISLNSGRKTEEDGSLQGFDAYKLRA